MVTNVQPIEHKMASFNEETLFWIFYSCPADIKQEWAAIELYVEVLLQAGYVETATDAILATRATGAGTRSSRFGSPRTRL